MSILITGGAGYIGSNTTRLLADSGERIIVLDNLQLGHRAAIVSPEVELVVGDIGDPVVVEDIFSRGQIDAVLHFAAWALVGESVEQPLKYYTNNISAPLVLLDAMRRHGTRHFIFSSTAATYGNPVRVPMDETHPQEPINPYGRSKLTLERILADCGPAWGLQHVILRYFNAAGSSEDALIGEDHSPETHLIPRTLMAVAGTAPPLTVFGTDYPTPDGTCVRDYVHVMDLAVAHAKALAYLRAGGESTACNLGTGNGVSVQQVIDLAETVTGKKVPREYGPRRPGDPPSLVADPSRARSVLQWTAARPDPRTIIESAWRWISGPRGGRY
ncbi:MAG TPA: UDP-glucose 4-epimerase GalE [Verrucomicrobiales bacterium]|nr:UDP-glucose 4-epimerase GalE [Verrucomicrobiales bacterium]